MILLKLLFPVLALYNEVHSQRVYKRSVADNETIYQHSTYDSNGNKISIMEESGGNCRFLELEDKSDEDVLNECPRTDALNDVEKNYDFINDFLEKYAKLNTQNDFKMPHVSGEMKAVYFLGITGTGKSTAVQILATDNSELFVKSSKPGGSDFVIIDKSSKIGNQTLISHTLISECFVDRDTNYVLCDNPGFMDTRSPIHEIVISYSMRKALRNTNKMKIAVVVTHSTVIHGNDRTQFLAVLKYLSEIILDIEKYKNTFYLIATKTENKGIFVKGQFILESDEKLIRNIGYFLEEVKDSLTNNSIGMLNDRQRMSSIKIVDTLLEKKGNNIFARIGIIRRPSEEGSLLRSHLLQDERSKIRTMLLNDENLVIAKQNDFGYPLSDKGILSLNDLFEKMNSYLSILSKVLSRYIVKRYESVIDSSTDINSTMTQIVNFQSYFRSLSQKMNNISNPKEFIEIIDKFSTKNRLNLNCLYNKEGILRIHESLSYLENFSGKTKYVPSSWRTLEDNILNKKLVQHDFLLYIFKLLTAYTEQMNREENISKMENNGKILNVDKNSIKLFLEKYELPTRYRNMEIDDILIKKMNSFLNVLLKHDMKVTCNNHTLEIADYIIVLSEIDKNIFESCRKAKEVVILAMHTVYIDANFTDDWFKGKIFTIIAPVWEVIGSRKISVDGMDGGSKLPKANFEEIGKNGENGKPGGVFTGVGMIFKNGENLLITANGGRGQDGQDGGDGINGRRGKDGSRDDFPDKNDHDKNLITIAYNSNTQYFKSPGSPGTPGSDSGEGGQGGYGGEKGMVTIYNMGKTENINVRTNNGARGNTGVAGTPGIGGRSGCDEIKIWTMHIVLFIPVSWHTNYKQENCDSGPTIDGKIKRSDNIPNPKTYGIDFWKNRICNECKLCENLKIFQKHLFENFHQITTDGMENKFMKVLKSFNFLIK